VFKFGKLGLHVVYAIDLSFIHSLSSSGSFTTVSYGTELGLRRHFCFSFFCIFLFSVYMR